MKKLNTNHKVDLDNDLLTLSKEPLLKNIELNYDNMIEASLYVEEYQNCSKCSGIASCPNHVIGYYLRYFNNNFSLVKCRKKIEKEKIDRQKQLFKTLYLPIELEVNDVNDFLLTTKERTQAYKEAVNFIQNYLNDKETKGLMFHGGFSSGKTYLLGCIAASLANNNITSLLVYFPDLVREIKNNVGKENFEHIINNLKEVDVLMLDDMGAENMSLWLRDEVLGPILNYRMQANKPIFISTNLTIEQFGKYLNVEKSESDKIKASRLLIRIKNLCNPVDFGTEVFKNK